MFEITQVGFDRHLAQAKQILEEYNVSPGMELSPKDFVEDFADFPGEYVPPEGCLLLAFYRTQAAGCVAIKKLSEDACEMKNLYVRPEFRNMGIGLILADSIIKEAGRLGYQRIRLQTLPSMKQARKLYESLGFKQITPYRFNSSERVFFMELEMQFCEC